MIGHVTLDGVEYCLPDERQITRSNANQMSAKIGSGAGDYDDQLNWNNFLMDNWEAGVGKKDPEAGGFLVATLDTRFKGQLALPPMIRHIPNGIVFTGVTDNVETESSNYHIATNTVTSPIVMTTVTIGPDEAITKLGNVFYVSDVNGNVDIAVEVLLPGSQMDAQSFKIEIWATSEGTPASMLHTETFTPVDRIGWFWYSKYATLTEASIGTGIHFAVVLEPIDGTIDVPTTTDVDESAGYQYQYNGISWTGQSVSMMSRIGHGSLTADPISHMAFLGSTTYLARGDLLQKITSSTFLGGIDTLAADISDLFALDGRLFIGQGNGVNNYGFMGTPETITLAAVPANTFALIDGLLWRSYGPNLYYTGDEVSWNGVPVGLTSRETITGFTGLNGEVIVSTNRAIYRIIQGDTVAFLSEWGAPSALNGKYMITFQGNVYMTQGESIIRFDGENFLPYGPDLGEGMPSYFAGNIVGFAANNNWLVCAIAGATSSVWAHNGQGWHFLAELPQNKTASCITYTSEVNGFSQFYVGTEEGLVYTISVADTKKSMRKAALVADEDLQQHFFTGWLETDWFYGGLREVQKDWESIYVDGENISAENYVECYWQEVEDEGWQLLGTVTEAQQELRWSDYDIRPTGKRLRVAVALYNSFSPGTPVVTAIRVKYMPMVTDRWRWQVPIEVKNNQEMPDGTMNERNVTEMVEHLDILTKQVKPFIFGDLDRSEYEVKVMNATRTPVRVEYSQVNATLDVEWMYNLVLEQVTADAFTAD